MKDLLASCIVAFSGLLSGASAQLQNATSNGCPSYTGYSQAVHGPLSSGPLQLTNARPPEQCRTFLSPGIEAVIQNMTSLLKDPDLARLFENCFASCVDTVVQWKGNAFTGEELCFIITGDIDAMWLRDSAQSLHPYQFLVAGNEDIASIFRGTINLHSRYITNDPYCNAFQPPVESGLTPADSHFKGDVTPKYNNNTIWTCNFELDSLAGFLQLSYDYWLATGDVSFFRQETWIQAVETVLKTMSNMMIPTYDSKTGLPNQQPYLFQSLTESGSGTLDNNGAGEPFNGGTGLVRTPYRPSDDAAIFQLMIPSNAMLSVQLRQVSSIVSGCGGNSTLASILNQAGTSIRNAIYQHGIMDHPIYGKVFAYEVDGFGSYNMMDDSNIPSLLSLPMLGFINESDPIYLNTRKMILNKQSNRYYLTGPSFQGIGGPHEGPKYAWPMAVMAQILTTSNKTEISYLLESLKTTTAQLGLMHEGINTANVSDYTRPWFVWANGLFGQTILNLADRFPELLFN